MYIWIVVAALFGYEALLNAMSEKARWHLISLLTYAGVGYSAVMATMAYVEYTKSDAEVATIVKGSRPCVDDSGKKYT